MTVIIRRLESFFAQKKGKKMLEYALAGLDNKLFVSTYMLSLPDTKTLENFLLRETEQGKRILNTFKMYGI
jgi:hypothetical protein